MPRPPARTTGVIAGACVSAVAVLALAVRPGELRTAAIADDGPEVVAGTPAAAAQGNAADRAVPTPEPPAAPPTVTLAFVGDVHGEQQIATALAAGTDLLDEAAAVLSAADLAIVNLETPVGTAGTAAAKSYSFQAPPALVTALAGAGVDVVSVANNHALDRGVVGLRETLALARAAGLATVGGGDDAAAAYAPARFEVGGLRIAVVGLSRVLPAASWAAGVDTPGLASAYDTSRAVDAVRAARAGADHVVVVVHWGSERSACPDTTQVDLAEALHAAGARVVVGAHPHRVQGIARPAPGQLTAFSLGNFLWYAAGEESGRTGVLTVTLDRAGVVDAGVAPFRIGPDGAPRATTDADAEVLEGILAQRVPGVGCPLAGVPRG
ncbi:MAG: CapA family protein [Actinobacteria bacterium]|nr:CapA family protein [Actinomycetota bacterium]